MKDDEITLIKNCKKGEKEAFQHLYKLHSKEAFRTAYLIIGKREAAEDVVQETFIYCYQTIKSLKKPEIFRSWMYKILIRTAWKVMKKEKKHLDKECIENYTNEVADTNKSVQNLIIDRETNREIYEAIKLLSPILREVIVLHYYNDMTLKDISNVLGCQVGTIKSRLFNARKALYELLQSESVSFGTTANIRKENYCNE